MNRENVEKEYFIFLRNMYEKYCALPYLDIYNREWQALFDVIYEHTLNKKETNFYYGYLHVITIEVLHNSSMMDEERITLNDFIENMQILRYLGFFQKELEIMKEEILTKASFGKILNLNDYRKGA